MKGDISQSIPVNFTLSADGDITSSTTKLILVFSKEIPGLSATNISIPVHIFKGKFTSICSGVYVLGVSGIEKSEQITVTVAKSGYSFTPNKSDVVVYYFNP